MLRITHRWSLLLLQHSYESDIIPILQMRLMRLREVKLPPHKSLTTIIRSGRGSVKLGLTPRPHAPNHHTNFTCCPKLSPGMRQQRWLFKSRGCCLIVASSLATNFHLWDKGIEVFLAVPPTREPWKFYRDGIGKISCCSFIPFGPSLRFLLVQHWYVSAWRNTGFCEAASETGVSFAGHSLRVCHLSMALPQSPTPPPTSSVSRVAEQE